MVRMLLLIRSKNKPVGWQWAERVLKRDLKKKETEMAAR